ncbi:MAG: acyl carrier protein [Candidatus Marinimicrobia bacterium]|nr:acyl carrier protein [Candidatus Neomarinimicrobiota bacterium]
MDIESRLKTLIAEAFSLVPNTVDENTGMDSVAEWDSLNQLRLVLLLEDEFSIALEPEEIVLLQDYKTVLAIIKNRL